MLHNDLFLSTAVSGRADPALKKVGSEGKKAFRKAVEWKGTT